MTWRGIAKFRLVTADLPRLVDFYRDALGFAVAGAEQRIGAGAPGGPGWRQSLRLGGQHLDIDRYDAPGRPHPGGDAAALWFQHLALVVSDMGAAFARAAGAMPISRGGPQLLPASSGGVTAFKFRDPDLHPLELLQFAADRMPAPWAGRPAGQIGLGIDHSAISVADVGASVAFYERLGLRRGDGSVNEGPAQQRLDGLDGVVVDVATLWPPSAPPHLELLGYRAPPGARGPALQPNDVAATRVVWRGDAPGLVRDPDGHLHEVFA